MQAAAEEKRQELCNCCERTLCKKSCRRQSSKGTTVPRHALWLAAVTVKKSQVLDVERVASRLSAASWRGDGGGGGCGRVRQMGFCCYHGSAISAHASC